MYSPTYKEYCRNLNLNIHIITNKQIKPKNWNFYLNKSSKNFGGKKDIQHSISCKYLNRSIPKLYHFNNTGVCPRGRRN